MKKFLLIALAAVLHSCAGGSTPLPAAEIEVRRALPVDAPYTLTLSEADVRATIAHMQTLAREQQGQLDGAHKQLATEHALHLSADQAMMVTIQEAKADHAEQSKKLFKARIFGFPISFGFGVFAGLMLCVFTKTAVVVGGFLAKKGVQAAVLG